MLICCVSPENLAMSLHFFLKNLFERCAVAGEDTGLNEGILASTSTGVVTDDTWKCTANLEDGWSTCSFDDSHWLNANVYAANGGWPWGGINSIMDSAKWIWAEGSTDGTVYCRKRLRDCKLFVL